MTQTNKNKHTLIRLLFIKFLLTGLFLFFPFFQGMASVSLHKANNIDLSNNAIIDMYQDIHGYMWIGTDDGLNLYNGKNT